MSEHFAQGELAALLCGHRRRTGLSQQALADLSTVSVRTIRDLESGRVARPRHETLELLANGLRIGAAQRAALHAAVPASLPCADVVADQPKTMTLLPVPPSAIIGRTHEMAVLRDLVIAERERLVAIVGISGIGKSRLAIEFARESHVQSFRDIIWTSPRSVEPDDAFLRNSQHTIAFALLRTCVIEMLRNEAVDTRLIVDLVGKDRVLLILDGHDATVDMRSGIANLLNSCPKLQILMTTSNVDNAIGWRVLPLSPLPVPAVGATDTNGVEAVRLLQRHLRHVGVQEAGLRSCDDTEADPMATICSLVDGVPSTLELVGQWSTVHTLERLIAELTDDPQALASWPTSTGKVYDTAGTLRRSIRRLNSSARDLLIAMADAPGPWSVTTAAARTARPEREVARDVHSLLVHGQIRPVTLLRAAGFVVLRLARHVALAEDCRGIAERRPVTPTVDRERFLLDHCGPLASPADRAAPAVTAPHRGALTPYGLNSRG